MAQARRGENVVTWPRRGNTSLLDSAQARPLLSARWEQLTPGQRREQLDGLRQTAAEWQSQPKWVEAHLEAVSIESLASGGTGWTQGEVPVSRSLTLSGERARRGEGGLSV